QGPGTAMIAPYQAFPTADGYAMVAAGSDALFHRLAAALGAPRLADDARFTDNPSRVRHRGELVAALSAITRELKTADLLERLRVAGVPSAPILTVDAVLAEPQTRASGMLVGAPHPRIPDYQSVGLRPPTQCSGLADPAPVTALADRSQAAPCSGHPRSFPASRTPLERNAP